jgi:hypothetical protein
MQDSDANYESIDPPQSLGDQAQSLGQDAKAAASETKEKLTSTLQEQASKIGAKATKVASDTGRKIETLVDDQRASGASYLQNMADLVHQAADVFDREIPQASQYIHQAAEQIDTVAEAVRTKKMREVAHDVQDFARRQPAIFFGGALLLGFAAVRVFSAAPPKSGQEGDHAGQ